MAFADLELAGDEGHGRVECAGVELLPLFMVGFNDDVTIGQRLFRRDDFGGVALATLEFEAEGGIGSIVGAGHQRERTELPIGGRLAIAVMGVDGGAISAGPFLAEGLHIPCF